MSGILPSWVFTFISFPLSLGSVFNYIGSEVVYDATPASYHPKEIQKVDIKSGDFALMKMYGNAHQEVPVSSGPLLAGF